MKIVYRKESEGKARVVVNGKPTGLIVTKANGTTWNYFVNFETPEAFRDKVKWDCRIVNAEPAIDRQSMHQTVIDLLHSELYMDTTQIVSDCYRVFKGQVSCYLPWCFSWKMAETSGFAVKVYDPADYGVETGDPDRDLPVAA